ncbi:MAG: potassium channel family protein, partial [Nitrospinota bacterium]
DATEEGVLEKANVRKAAGLVTCLPDDKDNIFVVLASREMNPSLRIVARAIHHDAESKLRKVGADSTVSANLIGGMRMASEMIRPHVVSFLDTMLRDSRDVFRFEEAAIGEDSPLVGKTLREAAIPQKTGLVVVAVRTCTDGEYLYNPEADYVIQADDLLVVVGSKEQTRKLLHLAGHASSPTKEATQAP